MTTGLPLIIHPDVQQALNNGMPVVALESTVISHGLPYPENLGFAGDAEQAVRDEGAVPATIAVIDGQIRVGLTEGDTERLAHPDNIVTKVSRRDLPFVVNVGALGATTVAATMIAAAMAGITVFATGGIGGVHRGASETFDVSADLQELARTPVVVVCAGPKSILDLGLTLEYLETHGVAVVGYQTDLLPAFYTRSSAYSVDYRFDTVDDIAQVIKNQRQLNFDSGMVIANPVPGENALDEQQVDIAINQALKEAKQNGVKGKATTPFLLQRVRELTGGDSLSANIALLLNNARLAAQIACAYIKLSE